MNQNCDVGSRIVVDGKIDLYVDVNDKGHVKWTFLNEWGHTIYNLTLESDGLIVHKDEE